MKGISILVIAKGVGYFLLSLLLIGLGSALYRYYSRLTLRRKLKLRFDNAKAGEHQAYERLKKEGYQIVESQKVSKLEMFVNGAPFQYSVRPDAFALKENKKYLVEVKTGSKATNPKSIATRRQLLEYFHGFDVDGVLLIDSDIGEIHHIFFKPKVIEKEIEQIRYQLSKSQWWIAFALGFVASAIFIYLISIYS